MILSNNALKLFDILPSNLIIRINVAWCSNLKELKAIVENATHPIYLDYPSGRTKPPAPRLKYDDVVEIANSNPRVKFFAFSNAEDEKVVKKIRDAVNKRIKLVPKIETVVGVKNLLKICEVGMTDMIMVDHEDLYVDVKCDSKTFNKYMNLVVQKGKKHNIKIYKTQGIIFDEIKY